MAVKGKGKEVASSPPRAPATSSSGKRRKGSGETGPSSSSAAAKRRRRSGVLQFVDDAAYVADEDEELLESEEEPDDGFFTEEKPENVSLKGTVRPHPLPFLVKEEVLSGDELEEFIKDRYGHGVRYAADRDDTEEHDGITGALKEPNIWRVKCMVGRERQMAFCFMQKFVDLQNFGTKLPIISAFALDHVRGFVFVEAEKACDVTEACKGFCSVYASRISAVPAAEVPSLLCSRAKPFELSAGTWVRMKSGNYKGDLAQVVSVDDGRKRVMIKLIPRVDLQAISKKFGGAISLKQAAVPAPRLISSQELEFFRPHIEMRRDRQTGDIFEVLDGLMFKDGFLYKRVAVSSLIYWGIQPTETELLKFSSVPSSRNISEDLDWVSRMYGPKKKKLPRESNVNASTREKSCKASNLKASTSNVNDNDGDDDDNEFNLHDLVLLGRKDFGVIIAVEKDGFRILKGCPEGSPVTVRKQDIKKGCIDKMFTAVDHEKKIISINDTVKVLEGPFQGKQGVVKHLYRGILFIFDESESENNGFFCAQCELCENVKKRKEPASSVNENLGDNSIPIFSESPITSYDQNEQDSDRPRRSNREQPFSIGQTLRIRKGPLKGYLCRVVRIFRNDVTVKLDSLVKIITVEAQFLSVPTKRGDDMSGAPSDIFGTQDTSFFGSQAEKSSWDNGLPSFGSDSWQPFSSSALPDQKADGEPEVDPWCKKMESSADGDSDPWAMKTASSAWGDSAIDAWGKPAGTSNDQPSPWNTSNERPNQTADQNYSWQKNVEVWSNNTTQKGGSSDSVWSKQTGGSNLDAGGSSWDKAAINKENVKGDGWADASRTVDMETTFGCNTNPWGSKVKEIASKETDSWEKPSMQPEKPDDGSQGWGQSFGNSSQAQEKDAVSIDENQSGGWDAATANCTQSSTAGRGDDDAWMKSDALPVAQDDAWGKPKGNNDIQTVGRNKSRTSNQNSSTGGWDTAVASWDKSSVESGGHNEVWGNEKASAANSKERNDEVGAWNKAGASDQIGGNNWDKPKVFGGDGQSSWNKGEEVERDNQKTSWSRNFEGGRGFGRGRGRGKGRESGDQGSRDDQGSWKGSLGNNDSSGRPSWRSDSQGDNDAGDSGGYRGRGRGRGQYGGRGRGRDNGWRNGDRGNSEFGRERSSGDTPSWENSKPNFGDGGSSDRDKGASKNSSWGGGDNWNAPNPSSSQPWIGSGDMRSFGENRTPTWNSSEDNKPSRGGEQQSDQWASKMTSTKGQEQGTDPWVSKVTSTAVEDNNDGWNTKAKHISFDSGGKRDSAASGELQSDPWANKIASTEGQEQDTHLRASKVTPTVGAEDNNNGWNTKAPSFGTGGNWDNAASGSSRAEEKADAWNTKGGGMSGTKADGLGWNNAGSSGGNQEPSWSKPGSLSGDQEPAWSKPRYGDDNTGYGRGGFGCGNRGRGRGRNFGDSGSSWGGNRNDESSRERSEDHWNRRDFDGGRGRGRGRFGRGGRNQDNFESGDRDGSGWGSGRGNRDRDSGNSNWNDNNERRPFGRDRGGGWSQSSGRNNDGGNTEGDQTFSKSKSSWGNDKNDNWGTPKPSGGDHQAGKGDQENTWSQNTSSFGGGGSWVKNNEDNNSNTARETGALGLTWDKSSTWSAPPSDTSTGGDGGSWGNSNEDKSNSAKGTRGLGSTWGEAEVHTKKQGSWEKAESRVGQGGDGSSWSKADVAWNSNKGGDAGNNGW